MMKYKLNQLGDFKNGANYPKDSYGKGDKIVNVKDLFRGRFVDETSLDELKPGVLRDKSIYQTEDGDILFTRSSLVRSGAGMCAMIHNPSQCILFCGFIIRYRLFDKTSVYPLYLLYLLRSPQYRNLFTGNQQTNITNINQDSLGDIDVYLPVDENGDIDYTEQVKLVSVLNALDEKIALNKKMNQKLEAMAKRLYDYWFVQFDFPDKNDRPYKTTGGPMTYNPTLKREIPVGWEVTRLGDLFKTNRGVSYSTPTLGTEGDGVPMINLASFSPNESYNEKGLKYYKGEYTDEKVLKPFDFVMCNTQQTAIDPQKDIIGRSMLVPDIFDGDIVSSHHVNTIKLEKENLKFYLNRLFNTKFYHAYISKFANGTNILGLIFSGVEDYVCEIPSDDLLEKFAKISLDIEKKKSKIIKENQKLTTLRDKLLPLLMNGQVEVV